MKMRKMIRELDNIGDTALADSVMEFAEPPAGMATQYNREHNTSLACNVCMFMSNLVCVQITIYCTYW